MSLAWPAAGQTTVQFGNAGPVDLGSNLDALADIDDWSYTLGTEWDETFTVGGIIGAPNTTVIPEVKILGEVIIPEVKADTRTGARMAGRVWGDVGLEFSADFTASRLEDNVGFNFAPTLSYGAVETGSFFSFDTTTGLVNDPGFTEEDLQLPGVDAQIDFFFNLDMTSRIDYGLFPVVPYNSVPFNPGGIHLDQRDDPNKSLLRFQASFDPDDNDGNPLPPTFTAFEGVEVLGIPLEQQLGSLGDGEFLASKQFSTNVEDKNNPSGPKPRIDLGEMQVVNPFGTGGDLLGTGTGRNLEITTTMDDDSLGFSAESALFRLGLDLDGIAAGLATGQSFTRIEEDIKIGNTKIAEIVADIIDLKYGPEVGFRESVEINPDFEVTLSFVKASDGVTPATVAINEDGAITLSDTFVADWSNLPEIALLDPEAVDVLVSFDNLTGSQSKRGAFFLTDYLEFTLLELESLNVLDAVELSLPPLFRTRTSLLGDLLGELELELYSDEADITPFALSGELPDASFTITPAPTVLAYFTSSGEFDAQFPGSNVRKLDGHTLVQSSTLPMVTLVIGQGDTSSESIIDFTPISVTDNGAYSDSNELLEAAGLPADAVSITQYDDPTRVTESWGIHILEGSTYEQFGNRVWELPTFRNDGLYHGRGQMTTLQNPGGTLVISGSGELRIDQHARFEAAVMLNGPGHTITLDGATGYALTQGPLEEIIVDDGSSTGPRPEFVRLPDQVVDADRFINVSNTFVNAGTLNLHGAHGEIFTGMEFDNTATGVVDFRGDGVVGTEVIAVTTPVANNDGTINVGPGARLNFRTSAGNFHSEFNGNGTVNIDGGHLRFLNIVEAYAPEDAELPDAATQTFNLTNGGQLSFLERVSFFAKPTINIDPTSVAVFNGLTLDGTTSAGKFDDSAPIQINNAGRLIFASGNNSLRVSRTVAGGTGEPTIVPIGLDNTGTVEIRANSTTGLNLTRVFVDAEIRDYAEGGATFDSGTWEIIGPTPTALFSNLAPLGSDFAGLFIAVDRIKDGENYLSVIDPGQPGGSPDGFADDYDVNDYDTFMATNRSDITLSGRAWFGYLNTVQTNHGTLTFDNLNHFITEGDLTNTGTINLTNGARLEVSGDFILDGGTFNGDATSSMTVGSNTIRVIGGTYFFNRDEATLPIDSKWEVRERTNVNAQGTVVSIDPAIVDYGNAVFPTLGENADITLAGATAEFRPLSGLTSNLGKLTLDAGNVLTLDQNLFNGGEINVLGGANLVVNGNFAHAGSLTVDVDSYALINGLFEDLGGDLIIDGVLEADNLSLNSSVNLSGSGRISGGITNAGRVDPGSSAGILQTFGTYTQESFGRLTIELFGPEAGEDHDQLLAKSAELSGILVLVTDPTVIETAYGKPIDILVTDDGITGQFDLISGLEIDADHQWVMFEESDRITLRAALIGDANFNGSIEQADLDAVLQNWGSADADWYTGDYNGNGQVEQADLDAVLQRWGLNEAFWTAGDLNNSGQVEQGDLDAVLQNWGATEGTWFGGGDINSNGQVEQGDLDIILQNWGSAAAPDFRGLNVPEPAATLALFVLFAKARRVRPR